MYAITAKVLLILAVLPGIFFMYQVYKLDKIEKEPMGLILKLIVGGIICVVPAFILELIGGLIIEGIYSPLVYSLVENFIVVACVEEGCKMAALHICSWKDKEFNYRFDAIVYAVAVGVGFAISENVSYAFSYGFYNTLFRAVTAIPAHVIFAIFMGHFYGAAKQAYEQGNMAGKRNSMLAAFFVPVVLHGCYDFIASSGSAILTLVFFVFIVALDFVAYKKIKIYSSEDEQIVFEPEEMEAPTVDLGVAPSSVVVEDTLSDAEKAIADLENKYNNM